MLEFTEVEFFREGYGRLADARDRNPGAAVCFPRSPGGGVMTGYCTCPESRKGSCAHLSRLVAIASETKKQNKSRHIGEVFFETVLFRLAALLSDSDPLLCSGVNAGTSESASGRRHVFTRYNNNLAAVLLEDSPASLRCVERMGKMPRATGQVTRADLIEKLAVNQSSAEEKQLNKAGMLTRRQAAEQSFWSRLTYHAFREYGDTFTFHAKINETTGDFMLDCTPAGSDPVIQIAVPRQRVRKVLSFLAGEFPKQPGLTIHPIPLKSIFHVTQKTKLDIEVRPMIQALQASGEARFFERVDFAKFRYGDLVYIKEMNILVELEHPDSDRRFASPTSMKLKKSQLPSFLDEHRNDIKAGSIVLDTPLRELSVFTDFDRMEITMNALQRNWYWLSIRYGLGDKTIRLADILNARKEGKNYLETADGWIDLYSDALKPLSTIENMQPDANPSGNGVPVSAANLLRLLASFGKPVQVAGEEKHAQILNRLLALAPSGPMPKLKGLTTVLRPYQLKGLDWLRFLSENELGGLLCDDMGLGKTHQAMALMVWLKEVRKVKEPFLVVCPTTVIPHWLNKLRDHAPGLTALPYHGGGRSITTKMPKGTVLLTSYGILRNDILALKEIPFSLAVFDEIQNLKNRQTLSYQAASLIQAKMCLGLTGTPIENSISELKSLFDLVFPGHLGTDEEYGLDKPGALPETATSGDLQKLKRMISPFTLRRLKHDVLQELPEKIEDLRTCGLSEMQINLYREAISTKGTALLSELETTGRQLPYIHIFALLNLLKRICDHPALALNRLDEYESFESGKWDLFQELLFETLESGQKMVVFTQYLGMISIMERLLGKLQIGFATLTGASQKRGEIIRRFNEEKDCRVFLGSLKAGGTGIDLVGGSTVLHYDRWWNAAREDQATDRVYRIGQTRAVQVFKLVAEGTLEEKISAIIERKRSLMNAVVQADDPTLSKIFTREELIDLLKPV